MRGRSKGSFSAFRVDSGLQGLQQDHGVGGDALLEIAFDQKGTKRLMAKSAGQFMHKL